MGINQINAKKAIEMKEVLSNKNFFIAEIDGEKIGTLEDYMNEIIEAFHFPKGMFENLDSFDSYNDWLRDLLWLGDYALFIVSQDKMLRKYPKTKETIFELFVDAIIPFWKDEVEQVFVGGKSKEFNVFIAE